MILVEQKMSIKVYYTINAGVLIKITGMVAGKLYG